jgi:hypothetical protein
MLALLYLDLLGMKSRWKRGGVASAKAAYHVLDLVVRHALEAAPSGISSRVHGGVQSDAAATACHSVDDAVMLGRLILRETFRRCGSREAGRERFWIRGVIRDMGGGQLEQAEDLPGAASGISKRVFSDDLLEAINAEQSGFKGQRLLVAEPLIDATVEGRFRIDVGGGRYFHPLAALTYSENPAGYRDLLWMFPYEEQPEDVEQEWRRMQVAMENRLRWAGQGGPAEFTQAAATQLVFVECNAIYRDL